MSDDLPQKDASKGPGDKSGMPQFQRPDGRHIDYVPDEKLLQILPYLEEGVLEGLGLQTWDEDRNIWLFPVEWYEHIPEGFEIITINEQVKEFDRDEDHKERRFGVLPFGISRPNYEPDTVLERWKEVDEQ
jgi:hypothetical protein